MPERGPDQLLAGFAAEFEAGRDPDPREWIERAASNRRQDVARSIDSYLMTAPRRAWDPVAFESSIAKQAVDRVYESIDGVSGSWPELLPQLRNRARIKRRDLVERLAGALGVSTGPAEMEKVGSYYHQMEHGLLPAEGVSGSVIDALADIVGVSGEAIRRAGATVAGQASPGDAALYARLATPAPDYDIAEGAGSVSERLEFDLADAPARDRIDELFTGG